METFVPQPPAINLSPQLYYQLVYTLTNLLPPPLDHSPEALRARNHAAIAKIASMVPVNANEADLAARSVVAGAQADDIMRLIRENTQDLALTMRLHAQYASMARTSAAAQASLIRVQAVRRKREAVEATATEDAWTLHIAEQSMLRVADPDFERLRASPRAARGEAPPAAPGEVPEPAPVSAPVAAPPGKQPIEENVSENNTNSHDVAFETPMSERPSNQGADLTTIPRDANDMIAHHNVDTAAAKTGTKPDPRHQVAPAPVVALVQAAPDEQAAPPAAPTAVAPAPDPGLQPPRMADPRDKLLWADAMTKVVAEMTAGLSALPPALRKQEQMRAQLLSSVATEVALLANGTPPQRPIVAVPKT